MLKDLADMVVDEMISYVDPETDLANRHALMLTGARLFDHVAAEGGISLLLFDISEIPASQDDAGSRRSPGNMFAELLQSHFQAADEIAHIGGYRFCVLLKDDPSFDAARATNQVSAASKIALRSYDRRGSSPVLVGRVKFDSDRHAAFDDMLRDADGLFFSHENPPPPDYAESNRFVDAVINWRKTIF